jgi:toxin CcdB
MAQFDVYENPSKATKQAYPFLLDIQNSILSDLATRIVIPLGKLEHVRNESMQILTPIIEYKDEKLILLTPQIASIPNKILKEPIGSLAHLRDDILGAIYFAVTGF